MRSLLACAVFGGGLLLTGASWLHAQGQPALRAPNGDRLAPGVSVRVYELDRNLSRIPLLVAGQTPNVSFVHPDLNLENEAFGVEDRFHTVADGFLKVDQPGRYAMGLSSDDGGRLYLHGKALIDVDGLHPEELETAEIDLTKGLHPFLVLHFDQTGDAALRLHWKPPGADEFTLVPGANLYAPADEVRVTAPGPKRVYDASSGSAPNPGDGRPLEDVHPSFTLTPLASEAFAPRVGGLTFLPDGTLAVSTWDGEVLLIDNPDADAESLVVRKFADGLAEPLGLCAVDGRLFVLQKQELTELIDHDGDGVADEYRCVASGWGVSSNFHEFAFGLVHADGKFYFALATAINAGGKSTVPQVFGRGTCVEVDAETGEFRYVAGGLRTPNGITRGPGGGLYITDNQGDWLPSSKLVRVYPGAHYGNHLTPPGPFDDQPETPPVVWLPQGEIGNSPGQPTFIPEGLYAGQVLLTDVTHGGLKRVYLDPVDGVDQGVVFRFGQGLTAGSNRVAWGPNGALYVGGIGSGGNWGQAGKKRYGLDRLTPTGDTAFEFHAIRVMTNGFEITLTEPLAEDGYVDPDDLEVTRWWYEPTENYGGPKKDVTSVPVKSVTVSNDYRRLFLEIDDLAPYGVYHVRWANEPRSAAGRPLWSPEAWYTLNRLPTDRLGEVNPLPSPHNKLTDAEHEAGWRLLFDGETFEGWRGYGRKTVSDGWQIQNGTITRAGPAGDLMFDERFGDFELTLDWKIEPGGNSGIFYRVADESRPAYETGPEMQVLDNGGHGDGLNPLTSAGALYGLVAPEHPSARVPGRWNRVRVQARGSQIEHELNGVPVVAVDLAAPAFRDLIAASKFAGHPGFARADAGYLVLQDHGDRVWYRNIKLRTLAP